MKISNEDFYSNCPDYKGLNRFITADPYLGLLGDRYIININNKTIKIMRI